MNIEGTADSQKFVDSIAVVKSQLSEALTQLAGASEEVREKQVVEGRMGLFQRAFLLYKPASARAWVPHIICWLTALLLFLFFLGTWAPNEDGTSPWATFVQNWKDPDTYFSFLFFLGIFLLVRLWGVSERKRYLRNQGSIAGPQRSFPLATLVALLYAVCGVAFLVGAVVLGRDDATVGIKFGVFGVIVGGCGPTLHVWSNLGNRTGALGTWKAIFLFLPPVLLAISIIFDIGGIVVKEFHHDVFGYWRSWIREPIVPLFLIPIAALPVYAGIRCLRFARKEPRTESINGGHRPT